MKMKILVVYYSLTGNTRLIAETAARKLGAEIEELRDRKSRIGIRGFVTGGLDSLRKKRAELAPPRYDIRDYDLVLVGTPVWAWNMAPAVRAYLTGRPWEGKSVALFCTTGGTGQQKTLDGMAALVSPARILGREAFCRVERNPAENLARLNKWLAAMVNPDEEKK